MERKNIYITRLFQLSFNIFRSIKKGHRHSKEEMLLPPVTIRVYGFLFLVERSWDMEEGEKPDFSLSYGIVEAGKREEKEVVKFV